MEISELYRIVVLVHGELVVNIVYAEVGGEDHEVFGAFYDQSPGYFF